jgi:hypothetical protein
VLTKSYVQGLGPMGERLMKELSTEEYDQLADLVGAYRRQAVTTVIRSEAYRRGTSMQQEELLRKALTYVQMMRADIDAGRRDRAARVAARDRHVAEGVRLEADLARITTDGIAEAPVHLCPA